MKQKSKFYFSATTLLVIGLISVAAEQDCSAQLETESTSRTQTFGNWNPPESSSPTARADLFPTPKPSIIRRRNADERPLQSQKPSMLSAQPPRARPLQPMSQNNMLQGRFPQEAATVGTFATVNHHEDSTAQRVLPLPRVASSWQNSNPPTADLQTQTSWSSSTPESNGEGGSRGLIQSVQSGMKDMLSGFQADGGWGEKVSTVFGGDDGRLKNVFGSLAIVIGGYLGFVWLMKKFNLSSNRGIPTEVIEVIGSAPYGPKKTLQLVRLGSKLLLLMNSPEGTQPVGEITNAEEVEYLISLCKGKRSKANSSVAEAVQRFAGKRKNDVAKMLAPTRSPSATESTFSTSQLVQALQSLQNSGQQGSVFEA